MIKRGTGWNEGENPIHTLLRLRVTTFVTLYKFWKSYDLSDSLTKADKFNEAKLHTATSSGAVYSTISVHKLEDLMVPRFC